MLRCLDYLGEKSMYCSECGKKNVSDAEYCIECGSFIFFETQNTKKDQMDTQSAHGMSFIKSLSSCFLNYANFDGRASRSEYWWFMLFYLLLDGCGVIVEAAMPSFNVVSELHIVTNLIALILLLPSIAVTSRRLHDTGRSGWKQLWVLTIIGIIPVIIWLASQSNPYKNKYGVIR